ncbi:MAG: CaiB/BaiF CoA-transferase family protein [Pseudomonadota bacterium]
MTNDPKQQGGPLVGLKVIEIAGIGPSPLCCSLFADLGAEVIRVDRATAAGLGFEFVGERADVRRRGRPSIAVDLKNPNGIETILKMVDKADVLIDPMRPGVMERLGLGPDVCLARNKAIVYARMTGWGQDGPLASVAGHDINYIALSGVLNAIGPRERPVPPLNVVGDMGGGAMFLALGVLSAVFEARNSGHGQVVDVSMAEGSAYLALGTFGQVGVDFWTESREDNFIDGGAPYYRCYETKDGKFVSIGSVEAKFYSILLEKLELDANDLPEQNDRQAWPMLRDLFASKFKEKTRDEWCAIMGDTDICFAPVLSFREAPEHPHAQARGSFVEIDGIKQPAPAPRFERTPAMVKGGVPSYGQDTEEVLAKWGFSADHIEQLSRTGAIGRKKK